MPRETEPRNGGSGKGQGVGIPSGNAPSADAKLVRSLVRKAWKATLSTLERGSGYPYASLVAVATAADGTPLLLLSGLAEHTKNITLDSRASLLFDGTAPGRAALTGPRVTLVGRIGNAPVDSARPRYLARHPDAAQFIDFADFRLLALEVEWAHMVAGFGRIVRLDRQDVISFVDDSGEVLAAEAGILKHMNADHREGIALMAAMATGIAEPSPTEAAAFASPPREGEGWQMIGCDPEGIDLTNGATAVRIDFSQRVATTEQVRNAMIALVDQARDFARHNRR